MNRKELIAETNEIKRLREILEEHNICSECGEVGEDCTCAPCCDRCHGHGCSKCNGKGE